VTHFGFVAIAYGLGLGIPLLFTVTALTRLGVASRRLATIDPRKNQGERL